MKRSDSEMAAQIYRSDWWSITLPAGWTNRIEPKCVSFRNEPPLGVLQVSAARKPSGNATLQDLYDLATDANKPARDFQTLVKGEHSGIFTEYVRGELFWSEWWLGSGATVVYLTYNVLATLQEAEIEDIRRIVESVSIHG